MLALASFCYRRRWLIVALWIVALLGISFASSAKGTAFSQTFSLEGSDSQVAMDLLKANSPVDSSFLSGDVVFKADAGVNDAAVQAKVSSMLDQIKGLEGVARIDSPYATPAGARQIAPGGKIAFFCFVTNCSKLCSCGLSLRAVSTLRFASISFSKSLYAWNMLPSSSAPGKPNFR